MTQVEQVIAIHNWVRRNMTRSTTGSGSESVTAVAYRALRDRRGDSSVYAALSEFMLTRAGIENMRVERFVGASADGADSDTADGGTADGGTGNSAASHHWLIVNPDERGWHHFDPFPTGLVLGDLTGMFTAAQAQDIARRIRAHSRTENYYTFNTALFPEIVQE
jgi:hypothetical protein